MASRLTATSKESGVGDTQDDAYTVRRAQLDSQFHALPRPRTSDYWLLIEHAPGGQERPLEVLARCLRERRTAGARSDEERVYAVILGRIQEQTRAWARKIAGMARTQDQHELAEDLAARCYVAVWQELDDDGPTFLLEAFMHALGRIQQHVAHAVMEQAGEWQRRGVTTPTRIPRGELQRLESGAGMDDAEIATLTTVEDPAAAEAFETFERTSDVGALLSTLDPDDRRLVYDAFYRGLTQQQIAEQLHVTDRTVRNRLTRVLQRLRARYLGGEESAKHG